MYETEMREGERESERKKHRKREMEDGTSYFSRWKCLKWAVKIPTFPFAAFIVHLMDYGFE